MDLYIKEESNSDCNKYLYPLGCVDVLEEFKSLEYLYNRLDNKEDGGNFSDILKKDKKSLKYKNCFDSLINSHFNYKKECLYGLINFDVIFRNLVYGGLGILEIVGSSGSGKTILCIEFVNKSIGKVLYLDINGSFNINRINNISSLILLRIFTIDELILIIEDLYNRLINNKKLPIPFDNLYANTIKLIIIDSLWCIEQLSTQQKRIKFLNKLSLILRRISWEFNISIIVTINLPKIKQFINNFKHKDNKLINTFNKWSNNCYLHIYLDYKLFYNKDLSYDIIPSDKGDIVKNIIPIVTRILHIKNGTDLYNKTYQFNIKQDRIQLFDINEITP